MTGFKPLVGEFVIVSLTNNLTTVYKQLDLYAYDKGLYAKDGGGFVRIMLNGHTSKANMAWKDSSWSIKKFCPLGKAMV